MGFAKLAILPAVCCFVTVGCMADPEEPVSEEALSEESPGSDTLGLHNDEDFDVDFFCGNGNGVPKVLVCHYPPGNPFNAHTICIGAPAVTAHLLNHGDYIGPCKFYYP